MKNISAKKILDFFKNLGDVPKQEKKAVSKRFPFGESLEYNGKEYRYLYSYVEDDIFFNEESTSIFLIPSKFIIPDEKVQDKKID